MNELITITGAVVWSMFGIMLLMLLALWIIEKFEK